MQQSLIVSDLKIDRRNSAMWWTVGENSRKKRPLIFVLSSKTSLVRGKKSKRLRHFFKLRRPTRAEIRLRK